MKPLTDPIDASVPQTEIMSSEPDNSSSSQTSVEEVTIRGEELVSKVKELLHAGNIRRIVIKNEEGKILLEIPLTLGVVGSVLSATLFPVLAALGVIGALVAHLTLVIEKREPS